MLTWNKETWKATLSEIDKPTVCILEFETADNLDLNGSEPVIKDGLVPVVIGNNGVVTKVSESDSDWYDYDKSIWANAVILVNNPSKTYNDGDTILESDIKAYFVWIPKYRYKLKSVNTENTTPSEFEIEINTEDTIDSDTECVAPNKSGETGTCAINKWMTHPAFTSLGEDVTGLWIGKFEATGTTDNLTVKPNVSSLRSINGAIKYNSSYNFNRNLDSHMMKNTEWGAMAYLTNSKYGRGNTEVTINSNSSFITGCTNTTGYFSGSIGASTTNNYSGIYDTSGGVWDMVMGNLNNSASSSGLNPSSIDNKYIDRYTGDSISARILGDATEETYGWNGDWTYLVDSSCPWFYRGGRYDGGSGAGVFNFNGTVGEANIYTSFRLVLSPTN